MGWGAKDYLIEIARGGVEGATPYGSYGERDAAATEANRVIWPNGAFTIPDAAGIRMSIASTSINDTLAGSNAQILEVHYLDSNLAVQTEFVELDGQTVVLTQATDIRFVNCMHVHQHGATASAAGTITAKDVTLTNTYSQISVGDTRCASSARMVPAGKRLFIAGLVAGAISGTAAAKVKIRAVASELDDHQYVDPLTLIPFGAVGMQDSSVTFTPPVPISFSAGTVVAMTVSTDKDATVTGAWFGWLENEE